MQNSTYNPLYWNEFRSDKITPMGYSVTATASANTTTTIDFQIPEDLFIRTMEVLYKNASFGDHVQIQVVDKDGIMTSAGTVLKTHIDAWYISPDGVLLKFSPLCPTKALKGLYLRFNYTSVAVLTSVNIAINLETLICLE